MLKLLQKKCRVLDEFHAKWSHKRKEKEKKRKFPLKNSCGCPVGNLISGANVVGLFNLNLFLLGSVCSPTLVPFYTEIVNSISGKWALCFLESKKFWWAL